MAAIREGNKAFYGMVIAQAQKIELDGNTLVLTFAPNHRSLKSQFDAKRGWVEQLAKSIAGRPITVLTREGEPAPSAAPATGAAADRKNELRAQVKSEPSVQAILDVFGGEVESVEEVDN